MLKGWLLPGALVLALALLGLSAPWWWPRLLDLAGTHSARIEGLVGLVQLALWLGAAAVVLVRLWSRRGLRAAELAEATLVDFDDEEIEAFLGKWTDALEKAVGGATDVARAQAEQERGELLAAVRVNPGVRSLAANPLLLTILALMKRSGIALPDRRVELYKNYVETLLKHWNLARSLAGRSGREVDLVETMKVLEPLALWMHEVSPGVGLVKEGELQRKLESLCAGRGHAAPAP